MTVERSIANAWERFVASDWWQRLDATQANTYEQMMLDLRKQPNSEGQAKDAFAALHDGLTRGSTPDYNDPFVAVSYLIEYQLSHCAMAFAVWWNFFDQHGIPSRLSVFDFAAGSGAGTVGLQLALALREQAKLPYVPNNRLRIGAYEPCKPMRQIGECFLRQFRQFGWIVPDYRDPQNLQDWRRADSILEVITSFHPALPWDTEGIELGAVGHDFRRTMAAIRPDIVIGTCHTNKETALRHLLGESNISEVITFPVDGLTDFRTRTSSFFSDSVPIRDGFEDPDADDENYKSLRWRSKFRFSFPRSPRVLEKLVEGYIPPSEFGGKPWSRTESQAIAGWRWQQEQERIERLAERRRRQEAERREKDKQAAERLRRERELQQERERQEKEERERPLWDELESLLASDSVIRCKLDGRLRSEGHSATWNGLSGFVPKSELGDLNSIGIGRTHFRGPDLDFILTAVNRGVDFTVSRSRFLERRRQEQQQAAAERQARELAKWEPLTTAQSSGETMEVNLLHRAYNRSGQVSGWTVGYRDLQGFMPHSQSGEYRDSVGDAIQDVSVAVLEVELPSRSRPSGNFVVSRRKVLDTQQPRGSSGRRQSRETEKRAAWEGFSVAVGDGFAGEVSGVTDFGVFVRLESGVEGLSHISQLGRSDSLSQFFVGQRVLVSVVSVDRDQMRLGLRIASG